MKKKTTPKKLTLSLETLRHLTTQQAQAAQGALTLDDSFNTYYCTGDSVRACCA